MNIVVGDMWRELGNASILLVTTNARMNKTGELVMGRGAALEAKCRFPGVERALAERISQRGCEYRPWYDDNKPYGLVNSGFAPDGTMLGAFQVKWSWEMDADLDLITFSTNQLGKIAAKYSRIVLNYPGIGNGRLTADQVEPILQALPDNVYIYKKG